MAPGYTDIDADGRGEPEAGLTSFLSTGNVPGIICAFGTLLAFVGQLLQWTQSADEWCPSPTCSQKDANRFGTYNLFLFIISLANLHSFMRKKPQVLYISTALLFSVLEQNVGKANEIREQSMSSTLLASYILSFIGVFTTFVIAFPFSNVASFTSTRYLIRVVVAALVDSCLIIGSIVLWSRGTPFAGPIPVVLACAVGIWHLLCSVSMNIAGLELGTILSLLLIRAYQPFSSTCTDECLGAAILIFVALWALVVFHLAFDCTWTLQVSKESVAGDKRLWAVCFFAMLTLIGGIIVWASKDSAEPKKHVSASEAWDVVTMTLASFIMIAVYVFKHDCLAIVAASLVFSVISSLAVSLMFHNGTGLRTGYIFVLFGSLCSFVGLPVVYSIDLAAYEAKTRSEEARPYIVSGFAIFCCVIFLWSEANYQGQLGFLALALIVFVGTNYTHGLHWVYVISLLLIADLTPFTTQQVGVYKVVILIVWITLLAVIYIHLSRFGSEAFQGGLFLFTAEHAASDADERAGLFHERKHEATKTNGETFQVQAFCPL
ncbi:hypothetical protein DIPPA_29946 [Diplonema papillatum]|nr:hypothetical protein DIPPA_29946 [Diplonema papillatum]